MHVISRIQEGIQSTYIQVRVYIYAPTRQANPLKQNRILSISLQIESPFHD